MKREPDFTAFENIRNPVERSRAKQAMALGMAIGEALDGFSAAVGRGIAALRKDKPADRAQHRREARVGAFFFDVARSR